MPVQFSPASWGNYLTTDFEPVDLLMDQDAIIQYVIAAQNQRNELVRRLSTLQSGKQDTKSLEKEVSAAKDKLTVRPFLNHFDWLIADYGPCFREQKKRC